MLNFQATYTMNLDPAIILIRNEKLLASEVGDDLVMMSIEDGKYFAMNKTGARIWNLLAAQMTYNDLCKTLSNTFHIPISQCFEEVDPFVEELLREKIISQISN